MTIEEALAARVAKACMGCANECKQPHFATVVSCRLMRTSPAQTPVAKGHGVPATASRAPRR